MKTDICDKIINIYPIFLDVLTPTTIMGACFFVFILLCCSALLSGSEVAYFSLSINDINRLRQQEEMDSSLRILRLLDAPKKLLATMLITNAFINIGIVTISDYMLQHILPVSAFTNLARYFTSLPFEPEEISSALSFLITVVTVTFFLVLFAEVAPKIYARNNNIRLARLMSAPLVLLNRIFGPFSRILIRWTNILEKRFDVQNVTSKEDIDKAIELTVTNEDKKAGEKEIDILKSIIKFGNISVKQIMCSRVNMVTIDFRYDYHKLMNIVRTSGFSRYPTFDEDIDNITGILYTKDLLDHLDEKKDFEWQNLIHPEVLYVPEAKKIDDLLRQFQLEKIHMAIVVDEYGGTSGVVTLEDIMEEVIGEIRDEFDDAIELDYKKIDDYNYIFEGKTLLNDVCRVIGIDTNTFDDVRGDADSLAGLTLELIGFIPKKDVEIFHKNYKLTVVGVNKRRIERVKVTLQEQNTSK